MEYIISILAGSLFIWIWRNTHCFVYRNPSDRRCKKCQHQQIEYGYAGGSRWECLNNDSGIATVFCRSDKEPT